MAENVEKKSKIGMALRSMNTKMANMSATIETLNNTIQELIMIVSDFGIKIDKLSHTSFEEKSTEKSEKPPNMMIYFKEKYVSDPTYWDTRISWKNADGEEISAEEFRESVLINHHPSASCKTLSAIRKSEAVAIYRTLGDEQKIVIKMDLETTRTSS